MRDFGANIQAVMPRAACRSGPRKHRPNTCTNCSSPGPPSCRGAELGGRQLRLPTPATTAPDSASNPDQEIRGRQTAYGSPIRPYAGCRTACVGKANAASRFWSEAGNATSHPQFVLDRRHRRRSPSPYPLRIQTPIASLLRLLYRPAMAVIVGAARYIRRFAARCTQDDARRRVSLVVP